MSLDGKIGLASRLRIDIRSLERPFSIRWDKKSILGFCRPVVACDRRIGASRH